MILGQMREAQQGEIFIKEINEDTLQAMVTFFYTGDFEFNQSSIRAMTFDADKYKLQGFLELLCYKMKTMKIKNSSVADILISADIYKSKKLKDVALEKLRQDREILRDKEFREKIKKFDNSLILSSILDLFDEI